MPEQVPGVDSLGTWSSQGVLMKNKFWRAARDVALIALVRIIVAAVLAALHFR